jgi:hypothetical protein
LRSCAHSSCYQFEAFRPQPFPWGSPARVPIRMARSYDSAAAGGNCFGAHDEGITPFIDTYARASSVGRSTLPFSRTPCRVVTALRMSTVPRGISRRDDARPAPPRHDSRTGALFQCPPALQFGRNRPLEYPGVPAAPTCPAASGRPRPLEYPGVPTAPTGAAGRAHSPQCLTPPLR